MGIPVLVIGESGSGKSTSLRNFSPTEIGIFNVASKPLPFRKKLPVIDQATYNSIAQGLLRGTLRAYAIDDSQYLLAFEFFDKAKETGYGKFTDMALNFKMLVDFVVKKTPPDCIVYFLHHTETKENGFVKAKTIGKMIDEKLTLEGLFSIVLYCKADRERHYFVTQSMGESVAKTPMDMFPLEIDNDLKMVDETIREYYDLTKKENENDSETE